MEVKKVDQSTSATRAFNIVFHPLPNPFVSVPLLVLRINKVHQNIPTLREISKDMEGAFHSVVALCIQHC